MAGPLDLRGRVTIVDAGATGTLKRIGGTMDAVARQARTASGYVSNIGTSANRGGRRMGAPLGGMSGTGMVGFGAAAGGVGFLRNEMEYQDAMNRTQAVLNVVDEKAFQPHRDLVVDLATRYPATSAEIAKGASELAMSGMSLGQVNEVLEATVQGAMASGESIKTVGMGVTDVVMGLGQALTNENFANINNIMAAGATSYAQDYTQFLAGLQKTAPIARVTGTSVEHLVGLLGILANAGFKAEKGGTALRTMMIRMGAPTPKARAQLAKYNIDLEEFRGAMDRSLVSGTEGMRRLQGILTESGLQGDYSLGGVEEIINNPEFLGEPAKLRAALAQHLSTALGNADGYSAEMLQEAVNTFVGGAFKNVDVMGLFNKLGETGAMNDLEALAAIFGVRFSAQGAAVMGSMFQIDPNTGKTQFDAAFDTFASRIPNAVERFSKILMQGLPGAVRRLAGAFDGLLRAMASSGAIDTVVSAINGLRDAITWLGGIDPSILNAVTLALLGLGVLAPIGMAISAVGGGLATLAGGAMLIGGMIGRITRLASALLRLGKAGKAAGGLFSLGKGAVGGAAAAAASARMITGMGGVAAGAASGRMIQGMSRAGTAAAASGAAGGASWLGKLAGFGARGLGRLFLPLSVGLMAWDAWDGYQKTGTLSGAALNALTFGLYSGEANAAEAPPDAAAGPGEVEPQATGAAAAAQTAAEQIRQIFASINLEAEGRQAMETYAAGIRAGGASAIAAARNVASGVKSAASGRVQLNTGPAMGVEPVSP